MLDEVQGQPQFRRILLEPAECIAVISAHHNFVVAVILDQRLRNLPIANALPRRRVDMSMIAPHGIRNLVSVLARPDRVAGCPSLYPRIKGGLNQPPDLTILVNALDFD